MTTVKQALLAGLEEQIYQVKCAQETQLTGYDPLHVDALATVGNKLMRNGSQIALRGLSFAGWETNWNKVELRISNLLADTNLAQNCNVIRMPVQGQTLAGISLETFITNRMIPIVNQLIAAGFYVIVDYHPITDWDRTSVQKSASDFWEKVAPVFKDNPKVLYELFNEPINPNAATKAGWVSFQRTYQPLVNLVRALAPENVIIMGNPLWATSIKYAAEAPFVGKNIMYAYHAYPNHVASSPEGLCAYLEKDIPLSLPAFFTEFGYSATDTDPNNETRLVLNPAYKDEMARYFLKRPHTCWTMWNYDDESKPAMLLPDGAPSKQWCADMLNLPVNFVPPAPLPDVTTLAAIAGAIRVWDADEVSSLVISPVDGLIDGINTLGGLNNAAQTTGNKRPSKAMQGYRTFAKFDGGDSFIVPISPDFIADKNAVTVIMICRFYGLDSTDRRLLNISTPAGYIELYRQGTGGKVGMTSRTRLGNATKYITTKVAVPDSKWIAIIASLDGVTGRSVLRVTDCEAVAESHLVSTPVLSPMSSMTIGAMSNGSNAMKADMHSLAVLDHTITQDECNQIYNMVKERFV